MRFYMNTILLSVLRELQSKHIFQTIALFLRITRIYIGFFLSTYFEIPNSEPSRIINFAINKRTRTLVVAQSCKYRNIHLLFSY